MMNYSFRLANTDDLKQIIEITDFAKQSLRESGSTQWNGKSGYPSESDFINDINNNNLYVLTDSNTIIGFEALVYGKDENYEKIDGKWLNKTDDYLTIHRIAISKKYKNKHLSRYLIDNAIQLAIDKNITSIKADTHELNKPMQNLLYSTNFSYCGNIYINTQDEDNKRLAFELKLK